MKSRLPRKYKKKVKKVVAQASAFRIARSAMVSVMGAVQFSSIVAYPLVVDSDRDYEIATKSLKMAEIVKDTSESISKIMSEKPQSWKDFLKTKDKRING